MISTLARCFSIYRGYIFPWQTTADVSDEWASSTTDDSLEMVGVGYPQSYVPHICSQFGSTTSDYSPICDCAVVNYPDLLTEFDAINGHYGNGPIISPY